MTAAARVGIFWSVGGQLVATGCPVAEAAPYGDCLTYDDGPAEVWSLWRESGKDWLESAGLPTLILSSEYDEHPRGRVVREPDRFVIYADRRLQQAGALSEIRDAFHLSGEQTVVRSDAHYRVTGWKDL